MTELIKKVLQVLIPVFMLFITLEIIFFIQICTPVYLEKNGN
jgi:hypothetical protein